MSFDREIVICPQCNGSGEGSHDGSTCSACKGSGEVDMSEQEELDYDPDSDIDDAYEDGMLDYPNW